MTTLVLLLIAWFVLYYMACRIWPFKACKHCKGSSKHLSPRKKAWRDCPACGGTGKRLRLFAR